jgi:hypothetical protein
MRLALRLVTGVRIRSLGIAAGVALLAAGLATPIEARSGPSAPRSGGGGHRAAAPGYRGGPAPRATAPARGTPAPRASAPARGGYAHGTGTAHGVARYGYGYGSGYGYGYGYGSGYPCWGAGWGWWGAGWYGGWWGWPGYVYGGYWPWYGYAYAAYPDNYVVAVEPPPSGPAIVETGVTPSKANVVLDGDTVGFASDYNGRWDKLSVAPGPHTIEFQEKGYRSLAISFEARPGATYAFNDVLIPGEGEDRRVLPASVEVAPPPAEPRTNASTTASPIALGRLRVHAEPPDAAVYLDGEYLGLGAELGRIHGALAVATGPHRLEAVRPGYVSASRAIEVGDTEVAIVELRLEPVP